MIYATLKLFKIYKYTNYKKYTKKIFAHNERANVPKYGQILSLDKGLNFFKQKREKNTNKMLKTDQFLYQTSDRFLFLPLHPISKGGRYCSLVPITYSSPSLNLSFNTVYFTPSYTHFLFPFPETTLFQIHYPNHYDGLQIYLSLSSISSLSFTMKLPGQIP